MIKWPEIQYVEAEDSMLDPVLEFPKQPEGNIGKYGNMRREYLAQHRKVIYSMMCLDGTLKQHLIDVNEQAHDMLDHLISQMQASEGVNETMKASDPLEWIRSMNSIRQRAEEVVKNELIYT
ncbi:MAG: TnpV protein [Clostridia bacterium]|nr:TnpV protein [Clostridia bacterium]